MALLDCERCWETPCACDGELDVFVDESTEVAVSLSASKTDAGAEINSSIKASKGAVMPPSCIKSANEPDYLRVVSCKDCKKWFLAQLGSTLTEADKREFQRYKQAGCQVVDHKGRNGINPIGGDWCSCKIKRPVVL